MTPFDALVWAFAASALGRLVAVDTVLTPARNVWLQWVGGLRESPSRKHSHYSELGWRWWPQPDHADRLDKIDISAHITEHGIAGVSVDEEYSTSPVYAASLRRGWLVDGLTCPACMAWWSLLVAGVVNRLVSGGWSPGMGVQVVAVWGAAQLILKHRG